MTAQTREALMVLLILTAWLLMGMGVLMGRAKQCKDDRTPTAMIKKVQEDPRLEMMPDLVIAIGVGMVYVAVLAVWPWLVYKMVFDKPKRNKA